MFNLFNPPFESVRTPIKLPLFDYLNKQTGAEVSKVANYYNTNIYNADIKTKLFKILMEFKRFLKFSPETLYQQVRLATPQICMNHKIVSPVSNGAIETLGELYNRNISELYISVEYPIDVKKSLANINILKPLRVISHDFSDFSYGLIDGKYVCQEKGLAIFSIDLALLAILYQHWYNNLRLVKGKTQEQDYYLPTSHFIARYLWSGVLSTHMDNVLFNQLMNKIKDQPNQTARNSQSFYLIDYTQRYSECFDALIDRFKAQPFDWATRLNSLPSIEYGSYFQAIAMPDVAPTRQVKWALILSKLKILEFLLLTDELNPNNVYMNNNDRNILERELRVVYNDKAMGVYLPEKINQRLEWVFNKVNNQQP